MARLSYKDYRSFGHGPVPAFMLAVPFWLLIPSAVLIGYALASVVF